MLFDKPQCNRYVYDVHHNISAVNEWPDFLKYIKNMNKKKPAAKPI